MEKAGQKQYDILVKISTKILFNFFPKQTVLAKNFE